MVYLFMVCNVRYVYVCVWFMYEIVCGGLSSFKEKNQNVVNVYLDHCNALIGEIQKKRN